MFFCQRSSYSRELETNVISCKPAKRKLEMSGKKVDVAGFEVLFEDTVFFPEGGGQNTDKGTVQDIQVLDVTRKGTSAVHFITGELSEGTKVKQTLDWDRRFDNMQQHSGQHLISALLENEHKINTMSWWMAENSQNKVGVSYIELDKPIPQDILTKVEDRCNECIQSAIPVTVNTYQLGDPALDEGHTRGLPADHTGPVRLIKMGDVDSNLCCGTHVDNLAHLQAIKLVFTESKKGKSLLYFLVGSRVLRYLQQTVDRERALTVILRNGPEDHLDLVEKMQKSLKTTTKTNSNLLKEIALTEANQKKALDPKPDFVYIYRREGDSDYISTLTKELEGFLLVVLVGEEKGAAGQLVVTGPGDMPTLIGKKLLELLDGKGGGKGSRFNAKINSFKNLDKIYQTIEALVNAQK